jgi:peptidoglycan hydrolase-like protein with peptidoglycan-binding domain
MLSFARQSTRAVPGLLALVLALGLPGTSLAAGERGEGKDVRASSGTLAPGSGYAVEGGSRQVRQLQLRLRRASHSPGPVDGLYGPQTEAAVRRFQLAHGLAVDGVVGPQTQAALVETAQVVRVQRRLHRLGYRSGPVDGILGPLTTASLQRYQRKQGLQPSGIADSATLKHLLERTKQPSKAEQPSPAEPSPAPVRADSQPRAASRSGPDTQADNEEAGKPIGLPLIALLGTLGATALWLLSKSVRDRGRRQAAPAADATPSGRRSPPPRVVGYARAQDPGELEHQAVAIEQACRERGWILARVVQDHGSPQPKALKRPGLAHALRQLGEGGAAHLVVDRLERLGRSLAELRVVLQWCARHDVDVVALNVGLDTSTREGQVAVDCLLALGNGHKKTPKRAVEPAAAPA